MRKGPGEPLWNGSPGGFFPPFLFRQKKWGRAAARKAPVQTPVPPLRRNPRPNSRPAAAGNAPSILRIRRLALLLCSPVPSPPAGPFLCRQRKGRKKPLKGTCAGAVPLRIPPPPAKGLRPIGSPARVLRGTKDERRRTRDEGRETKDGGNGLPKPVTSVTGFAMTGTGDGKSAAAGACCSAMTNWGLSGNQTGTVTTTVPVCLRERMDQRMVSRSPTW